MADEPTQTAESPAEGNEPEGETRSNRDFAQQRITKDRDKWKSKAMASMDETDRLRATIDDLKSQLEDQGHDHKSSLSKLQRDYEALKSKNGELEAWQQSRIQGDRRDSFVEALAQKNGISANLMRAAVLEAASAKAIESSPETFDDDVLAKASDVLKSRMPEIFKVAPIGGNTPGATIDRGSVDPEVQRVKDLAKRNAPQEFDPAKRRTFMTTGR